ncbi:MAG: alginate export family protein [Chthoniobacterales bacterium]|nr:alginate export family protein [Chthoniobacterales bacterium]
MTPKLSSLLLLLTLVFSLPLPSVIAAEPTASAPVNGSDPKEVKAPASKPEFKRPPYNPVSRWKEDWSGLRGRDRNTTGDAFDPLKFIPFNEDGSIWLSLGGGLRGRLEHFSNFNFNPSLDATYFLYHLLLHGDLHITKFVRVYIEGIDAQHSERNLPGGLRATDVNSADLNQAFLDLNFPVADGTLTLRGGRQSFAFGKQRLVSPLPWGNAYRHWDGVTAIVESHGWNATGFWSEFAPVDKYDFDEPDGQTKLFGLYVTHGKPVDPLALDVYFLGLDKNDPVTFNRTTGDEERYTIGGRVFGAFHGFDYEVENAYQFGSVGSGDVSAWMLATEAGYTCKNAPLAPRLWLGFDYASGDDGAGGDVGTFNQLFPLGHAYFGYADVIGRQNIVDIHPGFSVKVGEKLTAKTEGHFFWRAEAADALYNAGGGVVRPGAPGTSTEVGSEVDVVANYKFGRHLDLELGYSHFFPGNFIKQTGPDEDIDFFYLQTQFYF